MSKRSKKPKPPPRRSYDLAMIKDFLENLSLELRAVHYEVATCPPPKGVDDDKTGIHPELTDQLARYMKKCNHVGLLFLNGFPPEEEGITPGLKAEAVANYRRARARVVAELIGHMDALQPLFEEAFS
jgi:hypothetical protein